MGLPGDRIPAVFPSLPGKHGGQCPGTAVCLKYSDLIYMETQSHYLQLHLTTLDEAMEVRTRLRDFAAQLPQNLFVQCHRGCIVNLEHIRRFSKATLTMSNNT